MGNFQRLSFLLLSVLLSSLGIADVDYLKAAAGHYEGTFTSQVGNTFAQENITSDLSSDKEGMKTILIKDQSDKPLMVFHFDQLSNQYIDVSGTLIQGSVRANKEKELNCFRSQSHQQIDLCFYRDLIDLEVTDEKENPVFSLILNKFAVEKPIVQEKPQAYDLPSAISRAWQLNFDNRIEFEHVVQAKNGAKAAKGNLLPHISFGSAVQTLTGFTFLNILTAAGDFLPFLFPTRWIQAKKAGQLNEAELDAMTLLRLDTAAQIEGLFYNYDFDQHIEQLYNQALAHGADAEKQIAAREELGFGAYPPGTTDNADAQLNFLEVSMPYLKKLLVQDKQAIAQAMGFFNPDAVLEATIGPENSVITSAVPIDQVAFAKEALERSVELRQLDFLITVARENKSQVAWNWLDPSGDPTMNLGFGLKGNLNVAASQISEMQIRRNQMTQILEQKAAKAATDYNEALQTYALASKGLTINQRRLQQIDTDAAAGKIDPFKMISTLQDYLTAGINAQTNLLSFRMARTRVDRLLLQGNYINGTKPPEISSQP